MVFSGLIFVFAFLVLTYSVYLLTPGIRARNVILLSSSLIFYGWGGPSLLILLIGMTRICYEGGRLIERVPARRRLWLILTLGLCLGLLGVFKYTGFFLTNLQAIFGVPTSIPHIPLPIGISFYTFQLISYVMDVYRGEVPAQRRFWLLLLYASLFHQCIAGPIIRYRDINEELGDRQITREASARGITRFACGLAKKAILANGCATMVSELVERPASLTSVSSMGILLAAVGYMLEIYLDFSAYSDMAIGMGLMIGFHYRENFRYPYIADSVTDFWRRWHISLSSFFRDYVYIPLGGNRVGKLKQAANLLTVWLLTGLWHGASWNFILWGLYYFILLFIEKFLFRISKAPSRGIRRVLRTLYTLVAVLFGWMLFYYTDLSAFLCACKSLFGLNGNPVVDMTVRSVFLGNVAFLAVATLACTPIIPAIGRTVERLRARKPAGVFPRIGITVYDAATAVIPAGLLLLSLLCLVGDSYNPFLYVQF